MNLNKIAKINQVISRWSQDLQEDFVESWDDFKDAKSRDSSKDKDWELAEGIANVAELALWFDKIGQEAEEVAFQQFKKEHTVSPSTGCGRLSYLMR